MSEIFDFSSVYNEHNKTLSILKDMQDLRNEHVGVDLTEGEKQDFAEAYRRTELDYTKADNNVD